MSRKPARRAREAPEVAGSPGWLGRGLDLWFGPVPTARIDLFARALMTIFIIYMSAWLLAGGREWLTVEGFHQSRAAIPHFLPGPLPPLSSGAYWPFVAWLYAVSVSAWLWPRRLPFLLLVPTAVYVQQVDPVSAFTLNQLFIVMFAIMALRSDRHLADGLEVESAWALRSMQASLLVHYCAAGIAKWFHGDWHEVHDILYGHSVGMYRTDLAAFLIHVLPHWSWVVLSTIALGFELFAPVLFLVRRPVDLRVLAFVLGLVMHVAISLLMVDLHHFSNQMMCFYILFVTWPGLVGVEGWIRARLPRYPLEARPRYASAPEGLR